MPTVIDLCSDDDQILPQLQPSVKSELTPEPKHESIVEPEIDFHDVVVPLDEEIHQPQQKNEASSSSVVPLPSFNNQSHTDPVVCRLSQEISEVNSAVCHYEYLLAETQSRLRNLEAQLKSRRHVLREEVDASFNWSASFPWDVSLRHQLNNVFHISRFRSLQHEALNATLLKRDVFAILPTGAGKSLIYQLAAVVDGGLTLVITPLISLSQDQQKELRSLGIRAEALDSTTPKEVSKMIYNEILPIGGRVTGSNEPRQKSKANKKKKKNKKKKNKNSNQIERSNRRWQVNWETGGGWVRDDMETAILFVTPEQVVKSKKLMSRLESMHELGHLSRICIDEAHCCSSWGHDFRSDYRKLGLLRRQCPDTPILALSATCSPDTATDVCKVLETHDCVTFRGSIDRANLFYDVRRKNDNEDAIIADIVSWLGAEFQDMCGIVYVLSRKEAESYADKLKAVGVRAGCYHGDMDRKARWNVHEGWSKGTMRVVVATIAFGLGVNNHHTRFVVHATMATSIEGYYQESGRCGRDGRPGHCLLLCRPKDFSRLSSFVADKGSDRVEKFYEMYRYASGRIKRGNEENNTSGTDIDITKTCRRAMIALSFGEVPPKRENTVKQQDIKEENEIETVENSKTIHKPVRDCCDLCRARYDTEMDMVNVDVSRLASSAVRMMIGMGERRPNERVTMLTLAQNWSVKGVKAEQMRCGEDLIDRKISVDTRLEILIELVLRKGLDEFFRHSSYAVNAYVVTGERADFFAYDSSAKVIMVLGSQAALELKVFCGCEVFRDVGVSKGTKIATGLLPRAQAHNKIIIGCKRARTDGEANKMAGSDWGEDTNDDDMEIEKESNGLIEDIAENEGQALSLSEGNIKRKRRRVTIDDDDDDDDEIENGGGNNENGDDCKADDDNGDGDTNENGKKKEVCVVKIAEISVEEQTYEDGNGNKDDGKDDNDNKDGDKDDNGNKYDKKYDNDNKDDNGSKKDNGNEDDNTDANCIKDDTGREDDKKDTNGIKDDNKDANGNKCDSTYSNGNKDDSKNDNGNKDDNKNDNGSKNDNGNRDNNVSKDDNKDDNGSKDDNKDYNGTEDDSKDDNGSKYGSKDSSKDDSDNKGCMVEPFNTSVGACTPQRQ